MALWDLFQNHTGRITHKWAHYFPVYEQFFSPYRDRPLVFFEIGCGKGGSMQLWKKYFGPYATIVGLDINPDCKQYEEEQIHVRIGSQSDTAVLDQVLEEFGTPDIVLDDGSHVMEDILASFDALYARTSETGIYMVEDLHTAYWRSFGGGLNQPGTFIEKAKSLIDELNADTAKGAVKSTEFTRSTTSMHFYDSMVVFQRGRTPPKYATKKGRPEEPEETA